MFKQSKIRLAAAAMVVCLSIPVVTQAQDFPSRPLTLVVGFSPGGGTDIIARLIAPGISKFLGQPVVVENRSGASGTIAAAAVAAAESDGYMMLMGHVSSNAMVPALMPVSYTGEDFTPVAIVGTVPQLLVVPAASGANTLPEFIEMLKKEPGRYNYASSGIGTQQHLAAELFKQATATDMVHIPYQGSGQALNDLIAGGVDANFDTVPTVLPHIKAGTLKALAVTTRKRISLLPNIPTVAEAGAPGFDVSTWYMLMGPKALPADIVERWSSALDATLADPSVRERLTELATEIGSGGTDAAAELLSADIARWKSVVERAGITPDK